MKNLRISIALLIGLPCLMATDLSAQLSATSFTSFIDYQKSFARAEVSFRKKEDTLQKQFEAKGLKWPANFIYIRSFKYDSQLEVWVKDKMSDPFKMFKSYRVCVLAGTLGPKRLEGDYQVPEGFYYINEFNPNSTYHLSLGINYPNLSDQLLSDSLRPGGGIYIHGSCVSVGCIPITDEGIEELYILAASAKSGGQDYIPVHIFPIRYNVPKSVNYLNNLSKDDPSLKKFALRLQGAYDYFEKFHQLPIVMVDDDGNYIINNPAGPATTNDKQTVPTRPAATTAAHRVRKITEIPESVHQWPQYPGGGEAFMKYLDGLGHDMVGYLPMGTRKAYVQIEFIVDKDGMPTNFRVVRGSQSAEFNEELISRLEKMPTWKPAVLNDQPVAKKMIQTVSVEISGDTGG